MDGWEEAGWFLDLPDLYANLVLDPREEGVRPSQGLRMGQNESRALSGPSVGGVRRRSGERGRRSIDVRGGHRVAREEGKGSSHRPAAVELGVSHERQWPCPRGGSENAGCARSGAACSASPLASCVGHALQPENIWIRSPCPAALPGRIAHRGSATLSARMLQRKGRGTG